MMEGNIDDRTSIFGMSKIYSMGDIDNGVDANQVESEFLKNYLGEKEHVNYSASNAYQNNLKQLESYSLGNYNDPNNGLQLDQRSVAGTPGKNFMPPTVGGMRTPHMSMQSNRSQMPISTTRTVNPNEFDRFSPSRERTMEQIRYGAPVKTEDERVSHTLHEMLSNSNIGLPIIPLVTEDDKEELFENCSTLREELKEMGISVDNIPEPHDGMSKEELERIFRRLRAKNDRKRATTTAEELIMLTAKWTGKVFNGQNSWFGYRPDARGWDATVKGKLKRMRFDTSNVVSGIMKDIAMSSGTRVGVELIPSFLLTLATNKGEDTTSTDKSKVNEKEWENSIADIADTE
jgi:hypothetical protein